MKNTLLITLCMLLAAFGKTKAQSIELVTPITFEEIEITDGEFWNGIDGSGNFTISNVTFENEYSNDFGGFWQSGWAVSKVDNNITAGFGNLYACFAGKGFENSPQYAVVQNNAYMTFETKLIQLNLKVTNSTYAGLSMQNGDDFAKKFGGETGNDPDYFKLIITSYSQNQAVGLPFEFYLADYRFENNNEDYIVNDWEDISIQYPIDVFADSVTFKLESSDVGNFGMNTPGFFNVDYISAIPFTVSINKINQTLPLSLFPNPSKNELNIDLNQIAKGNVRVYNIGGKMVMNEELNGEMGIKRLDISALNNGFYVIEVQSSNQEKLVGRFVKND